MAERPEPAVPEPAVPEPAGAPDPAGPLPPPRRPLPPPSLAALAGAAAAAVALATGEVVSGLPGTGGSLVAAVGTAFIDRFAGPLKDPAVALFGTNDKAALITGIVVVALLAGAALGVGARRRPWLTPVGFGAFGLLGALVGRADPQADGLVMVVAAAAGVAAGVLTLRALLRRAVPTDGGAAGAPTTRPSAIGAVSPAASPGRPSGVAEDPRQRYASRRAFFGWAGAAGAGAVALAGAGRALAGRSRAESARSAVRLPPVNGAGGAAPPATVVADPAPLGVPGLSPYLVPNDRFYRIDTALVVPQVDLSTWRLRVTGMVDRPFELGFDDLLALPQVEEAVTLSCVSNEVGGDLVGNARWQGVPLRTLLERAGVQPGATQIVGRSTDGWTAGFPTEVALDGRVALVAVGMNGEPLPVRHGFPARLVVAGLYGYVSATKWLQEIQLTRWEDFDGYWIDKGWSKRAPIKTQSRIDVPGDGAPLRAGPTKVAGVAWAPTRGVQRVEVQVDDGPWQEARLAPVLSANTWVQWVLDWEATPGDHVLRCRATDGTGATQTGEPSRPDPDGATGWHRVPVTVAG